MIMTAKNNGRKKTSGVQSSNDDQNLVRHGVCEVVFKDGDRVQVELVRMVGFDKCVVGLQMETETTSSALVYDANAMIESMRNNDITEETVSDMMEVALSMDEGPHTPIVMLGVSYLQGFTT